MLSTSSQFFSSSSVCKTSGSERRKRLSKQSSIALRKNRTAAYFHFKVKKNGIKSLNVLMNNIGNCRYPGFSEFQSENSLQNSSYCWSFTKEERFKTNNSLTQSMYNSPGIRTTRTTTFGIGERKTFPYKKREYLPSPDTYSLTSIFDMNIKKKKGASILPKSNDTSYSTKTPGVGTYTVRPFKIKVDMPIKLKSRIKFFYDDEYQKRKHCVSMQRYHPSTKLEENLRFREITFGKGNKIPSENTSVRYFPGPGAYNVPGCFDRGYKKKLPLN